MRSPNPLRLASLVVLACLLPPHEACDLRLIDSRPINSISWTRATPHNSSAVLRVVVTSWIPPFLSPPQRHNSSQLVVCSSLSCVSACPSCERLPGIVDVNVTASVLLQVVRQLSIKRLVVFYSASSAWTPSQLSSLTGRLSAAHVASVTIPVGVVDDGDEQSQLQRTLRWLMEDKTQYRHFLTLCDEVRVGRLLDLARRAASGDGLLSQRFYWLVVRPVGSSAASLPPDLPAFSNVAVISGSPALNMSGLRVGLQTTANRCGRCDAKCVSDVRLFLSQARESAVSIRSTLTAKDKRQSWKTVLMFDETGRETLRADRVFPNTFVDLGGRTLRVAVLDYPPMSAIIGETNGSCLRVAGVNVDVMLLIASRLHFTPCFVTAADGQFGVFNESSKRWTGVVGMVGRGEANLTAGALYATHPRTAVVDFSRPVRQDRGLILMRRRRSHPRLFGFTSPLQWSAWCLLLAAILVASVAHAMISRPRSLPQGMWNSLSVLLEQGQAVKTEASSSLVVVATWWICCIVVINCYTSALIVHITVPPLPAIPRSLADIAAQSDIRPLSVSSSSDVDLLKQSRNPVFHTISEMFPSSLPDEATEAMEMVRLAQGGEWAYLSDESYAILQIHNDCRIVAAAEPYGHNTINFAMTKNAVFEDAVNDQLSRIVESGWLEHALTRWIRYFVPQSCELTDDAQRATPFTFRHTAGVFALLSVFCLAAAVVLAVERRVFRRRYTIREDESKSKVC